MIDKTYKMWYNKSANIFIINDLNAPAWRKTVFQPQLNLCATVIRLIWRGIMDFLDVLGYIGLSVVVAALLLGFSFVFSRRPTQTMLYGENIIKRRSSGDDDNSDGDNAEIKDKNKSDKGDWDMAFHVVKRYGYGNWKRSFYVSIALFCASATLLYYLFAYFSLFKSIGLGALTGIALFLILISGSRLFVGKIDPDDSRYNKMYLIFTLITCALSGAGITVILYYWELFIKTILDDIHSSASQFDVTDFVNSVLAFIQNLG